MVPPVVVPVRLGCCGRRVPGTVSDTVEHLKKHCYTEGIAYGEAFSERQLGTLQLLNFKKVREQSYAFFVCPFFVQPACYIGEGFCVIFEMSLMVATISYT